MKKVIRMTESDLTRLVKRVIKEQSSQDNSQAIKNQAEVKRLVDEIKRGVGSFGNTNVETLISALSSLKMKDSSTIREVYRLLKITSMEEYLDDEFMAYSMTKGQKNDPLGKKIFGALGGEKAEKVLGMAKSLDAKRKQF